MEISDKAFIYKYISVKIRNLNKKKEKFKTTDLIITKTDLIFLNYTNKKFELLFNVCLRNLTKLTFSKNILNCLILHDNKALAEGIEIQTESASSLLTLIDDLFQNFPEHLKNGG